MEEKNGSLQQLLDLIGLSIISAAMLNHSPNNEPFDLASIYHEFSLQGNLLGHEVYSRFYEIGSLQGWHETNIFLSNQLD